MQFLAFITWVWFAVVVGVFADQQRNRNGGLWFFLALVFSPLAIFPMVASLRAAASTPV
jgi:hypothetical protein